MSTLLERIRSVVADHGERIAHVGSGGSLNYRELWLRAHALAAHLVTLPPGPVMVIGHKEPFMLVGFLGSVLSGRAYIPVDISLPAARVERIQATASPAAVLTMATIESQTKDWQTTAERPFLSRSSSDPFYIIFTSGSTGDPKGVIITEDCLTAFIDWMLSEQSLRRGEEVFLNQAPFSFDLSVMDLYLSLITGGTLVSLTKEDIADSRALFAKLRTSGLTVWVSTPSFAQMCLVERGFDATMLPGMRRFLFCGEALAHKTASGLVSRFPEAQVWNTYGPTEAAVATTSVLVDAALLGAHDPLPIGYQRPGSTVVIRRPDGSPADDGERGEIVILGPNVSPGYLARPDLTAAAFFDEDGRRGYKTGDRGYAKEGLLFFEGRMDFQVKVRGHRIELGDVEAHVREIPGVVDAVVLPVERRGVCESLAAFVVMRDHSGDNDFAAAQSLKAMLATRIPDYMLPRRIDFLESFPITPNGKADRKALAARLS
ncbi:MAG: dltA [Verrucomicrobiaceae bacterium]|nr:dltA [Verrucomicrobiaceae bacterium]